MSVALLREMFDRMVVAKNAELIEHYYDPDFLMYSDGLSQSFAKFRDSHRKLYATAISYAVEYDEHAWVEAQTRLPGGCGSPRRDLARSRPASRWYSLPPTATAEFTGSGRRRGRVGATWPPSTITETTTDRLAMRNQLRAGAATFAAWSDRYRHKVRRRTDAVALINTTTGDLVRKVKLLSVPRELSPVRVLAGRSLVNTFGGFPLPGAARALSRHVISTLAVAADADPSATRLVYELFTQTSAAGRGGCAKMLVEEVGSAHLNLDGLTVPTLVIGGVRDRLTPISQSRRIARTAPNVVGLVELPGGHCSMLERHQEVNSHLRALAESVTRHVRDRRISS